VTQGTGAWKVRGLSGSTQHEHDPLLTGRCSGWTRVLSSQNGKELIMDKRQQYGYIKNQICLFCGNIEDIEPDVERPSCGVCEVVGSEVETYGHCSEWTEIR